MSAENSKTTETAMTADPLLAAVNFNQMNNEEIGFENRNKKN